MEVVYLIMREEGQRTDGYYYQSETSVIAGTNDPDKAAKLLKNAAYEVHEEDEKPIRGSYDNHGDTEIVFDSRDGLGEYLEDRFWIHEMLIV